MFTVKIIWLALRKTQRVNIAVFIILTKCWTNRYFLFPCSKLQNIVGICLGPCVEALSACRLFDLRLVWQSLRDRWVSAQRRTHKQSHAVRCKCSFPWASFEHSPAVYSVNTQYKTVKKTASVRMKANEKKMGNRVELRKKRKGLNRAE